MVTDVKRKAWGNARATLEELMTRITLLLILAFATVSAVSAQATPATAQVADPELELLLGFMTGSFSSAEQARLDPDFYDIRLQVVRVWPERQDGYWLYVEQAAAESLDRPYRQRVYRLLRHDSSTIESRVFTIPEPLTYAGEWKKEVPLARLTPESLVWKKGCSIMLVKKGTDAFAGSTVAHECASDLRGAAYAKSEVEINSRGMVTWDRGFAADGRHVWGASKGGYIFKKL